MYECVTGLGPELAWHIQVLELSDRKTPYHGPEGLARAAVQSLSYTLWLGDAAEGHLREDKAAFLESRPGPRPQQAQEADEDAVGSASGEEVTDEGVEVVDASHAGLAGADELAADFSCDLFRDYVALAEAVGPRSFSVVSPSSSSTSSSRSTSSSSSSSSRNSNGNQSEAGNGGQADNLPRAAAGSAERDAPQGKRMRLRQDFLTVYDEHRATSGKIKLKLQSMDGYINCDVHQGHCQRTRILRGGRGRLSQRGRSLGELAAWFLCAEEYQSKQDHMAAVPSRERRARARLHLKTYNGAEEYRAFAACERARGQDEESEPP